ncbi:MAG: NAD(P)/FAD-dependent oxidoreductase [Hyphomonadaceae bacterium]
MRAGSPPASYDAIIVGAGAAGLYCALTAGQRGRRVLVLERNAAPGAKILISGGGRCNFTNLGVTPERFLSANPHFARSALARCTPGDVIALLEKHRIAYYEKTLGQLFGEGAGAARRIVRMLLDECAAGDVEIRTGIEIGALAHGAGFRAETSHGVFEASALVLASGGLSIPKLGASDLAYRTAQQFGLPLIAARPGLAPLTFAPEDAAWMRALSGVSAEIIARAGAGVFREAGLFTHRGLSGPAILQASSYWTPGQTIDIDWAPDLDETFLVQAKRAQPRALVKTVLASMLPARLAQALAPSPAPLGDHKDQALIEMIRALKAMRLRPAGTEGYAKAEVTVGGVDTRALKQQTMMAAALPGLFFIGEAVDVTGWLGGYNFQWAWASGRAAGLAL